jgi:hypothetical protein
MGFVKIYLGKGGIPDGSVVTQAQISWEVFQILNHIVCWHIWHE